MSGERPFGFGLYPRWYRKGRLIVALGLLLVISAIMINAWVFDRHTVTIRIKTVDLPVNCQRASRGFFGRTEAQRDVEPKDSATAFCGWVWSDHGPFGLPQSNAMPLIQTDRVSLIAAFQSGCRYKVTVVGTRARPSVLRTRKRKAGTIIRIDDTLPCL